MSPVKSTLLLMKTIAIKLVQSIKYIRDKIVNYEKIIKIAKTDRKKKTETGS